MNRVLVVAAAMLCFVPAAAAGTMNPCLLVTSNDASTALSTKTGKGKSETLGLFRACTYTGGRRTLTVLVRTLASKAAFEKSAKATKPGPVFKLPGIGDDAFSTGAGSTLLVWKKGVEISFTFIGTSPFVQTQKDLATAAIARL